MKKVIAIFCFLVILFPFYNLSQCNTNTTICSLNGTSQTFNFQTPSGNPSSCLDFFNGNSANYGYIVLYITQTGSLDLLIQGNNAGIGCLDVSIFDITGQNNPCGSLSTATEIACNYVSPCEGCAEFGSANLGCNAVINTGTVSAGDVIMILVEDWSDTQSSFTLELGNNPNSAQTGLPDATIDPNSIGPFCTTDGLQQILAGNMGGTWSGPGMSANGMFNPAVAGVGTHTINYSIGIAPCNSSSSIQITVGSITMSGLSVGACQPGGVYGVTGNIQISNPPPTGQLIVENCEGLQTVVATAPFSVGSYPFNLSGLTANGAACDVHAYFTNSDCSHILTYTAPACPASCGFTNLSTVPGNCQPGNTYNLTGTLNFNNPPATGQLIVQDCSGNTATFNAPFTSPLNYSINTLTPNGQSCAVTAHFTAEPACTITTNYTRPAIPVVSAGADVSVCQGSPVTLTGSGATSYSWSSGGTTASATVTPTTTTTYTVTGTTNGCTATDQVVVTVNTAAQPTVSPNATICSGQSTVLTAGGGGTYSWNNGLGAGASHTVSPTTTTTYTVTVTDANNCQATNQTTVSVNALPVIYAANITVCESGTEDITASGALNYTWSPASHLSATTGETVTFTPGASTTYTITGTDANGCIGTTTVSAVVGSNPSIDAGADINECEGNQITLTGSGAGAGGMYQWASSVGNTAITNGFPFVPPVGITTYTVTGTTSTGCVGTDIVTVSIDELPEVSFTVTQDQACVPVVAIFQNTSLYGNNCIWTFDNGQTVSGCGPVTQTFGNPGVFGASLQLSSPNGCISTVYQDSMVIVDATPVASFIPKPAVFPISNPVVDFENHSTGATSYRWNFGHGNAESTENSPSYTYPEEVAGYEVTLIAYSEGGCMDTVRYTVNSQEDLIFYIPNTFTPDGDEYNQSFQPVFTSGFDPYDYSLFIFNRWGEMVFESHDTAVGWKGTYGKDGNECQQGTYTWKIEFKTLVNDERKMYVGNVNILR